MDGLKVIASGDTVDVVLPDATETQAMTFEGIGLEEGRDGPVAVLRKGLRADHLSARGAANRAGRGELNRPGRGVRWVGAQATGNPIEGCSGPPDSLIPPEGRQEDSGGPGGFWPRQRSAAAD